MIVWELGQLAGEREPEAPCRFPRAGGGSAATATSGRGERMGRRRIWPGTALERPAERRSARASA